MTNGCPLSHWGKNSRVDHGVSDSITGPYKFDSVAIPTWAHNPATIRLKDGTYAIVHIGDGAGAENGGDNCTGLDMSLASLGHVTMSQWSSSRSAPGSTIHVSKTLDGPWTALADNTLGSCNNPAPWVHVNGTIFIVCGNNMLRSENIYGPWKGVATFSHSMGPVGTYEDPYLYITSRGFHLLYHVYNTQENPPHGHECTNSTVSAHAFSTDGLTWHMSKDQPYGTQIPLSTGETVTVATRERPKVSVLTLT